MTDRLCCDPAVATTQIAGAWVSFGHLALVRGEGRKDLTVLPGRHLEVVQRLAQFLGHGVEFAAG